MERPGFNDNEKKKCSYHRRHYWVLSCQVLKHHKYTPLWSWYQHFSLLRVKVFLSERICQDPRFLGVRGSMEGHIMTTPVFMTST